jgi:hypothetical protein
MATFTDEGAPPVAGKAPGANGEKKTWSVVIHTTAVEEVRNQFPGPPACDKFPRVDLGDLKTMHVLMQELDDDPVLLCNLIYFLCREQADAAKISDVEFGRRMDANLKEALTPSPTIGISPASAEGSTPAP